MRKSTKREWQFHCSALVLVLGASSAVACSGARPAPAVSHAGVPSYSPTATAHAANLPSAPAVDISLMPLLKRVIDDPRLTDAKARELSRDWLGAAKAIETAWNATPPESADKCSWAYLAGRFFLTAGDSATSTVWFERVLEDATCSIAPYAHLRAAQAYIRLNKFDSAVAHASVAASALPTCDDASLTLADAYVLKTPTKAIPLWRALLAKNPKMPRWGETAVRLASALLDSSDEPADVRAKEAFALSTRVLTEAPRLSDSLGVSVIRSRAAALLRATGQRASEALTEVDRLRQAQAWLDAKENDKAIDVASPIAKPKTRSADHSTACKAAIVRAQASPKGKSEALEAWTHAISLCEGDDQQAVALYGGGKASFAGKRAGEALSRFSKIEAAFPKHRLADDARLYAASIFRDQGDEAKYVASLSTLPDNYPEGDMVSEGLFRLALYHLGKSNWASAETVLDKLVQRSADDRHWSSAGRASYFRARVSELTGRIEDAKGRYHSVITNQPLTYYMGLAYSRLRMLDPVGAREALADAVSRETTDPLYTREHPEFQSAPFLRAMRLLEIGEVDLARREFAQVGNANETADSETTWTIAFLLNSAQAPEYGHAFSRKPDADFLAHYPSGRWRIAWEAAFPKAFEPIVLRESTARSIPATLTWAIMREESGFLAEAKSGSNAFGLMQLLVPTARGLLKGTIYPAVDELALKRPDVSITLGSKFLSALRSSFAIHPALAIAAYNAGPGAVRRWLDRANNVELDTFVEEIPYDETRNYVKRVLASQIAYAYLYAPMTLDDLLAAPPRVKNPG